MQNGFFEFLVTAVLSLAITFVLFRWLESRAEGQSTVLGGTIKYGGALAGFVLVFWLSSYLYGTTFVADRTTISLEGEYTLEQLRSDGQTRRGSAVVRQKPGSPRVDIAGEIESRSQPYPLGFQTVQGLLHERRLIWIYENDRKELGVGFGTIMSDRPDRIVVTYGDVGKFDRNADPSGQIVFTRRK